MSTLREKEFKMIRIHLCPLCHAINVAETEWKCVRKYKKAFITQIFSVMYGEIMYQGRKYVVDRDDFCPDCEDYLDSGLLE